MCKAQVFLRGQKRDTLLDHTEEHRRRLSRFMLTDGSLGGTSVSRQLGRDEDDLRILCPYSLHLSSEVAGVGPRCGLGVPVQKSQEK